MHQSLTKMSVAPFFNSTGWISGLVLFSHGLLLDVTLFRYLNKKMNIVFLFSLSKNIRFYNFPDIGIVYLDLHPHK